MFNNIPRGENKDYHWQEAERKNHTSKLPKPCQNPRIRPFFKHKWAKNRIISELIAKVFITSCTCRTGTRHILDVCWALLGFWRNRIRSRSRTSGQLVSWMKMSSDVGQKMQQKTAVLMVGLFWEHPRLQQKAREYARLWEISAGWGEWCRLFDRHPVLFPASVWLKILGRKKTANSGFVEANWQ